MLAIYRLYIVTSFKIFTGEATNGISTPGETEYKYIMGNRTSVLSTDANSRRPSRVLPCIQEEEDSESEFVR